MTQAFPFGPADRAGSATSFGTGTNAATINAPGVDAIFQQDFMNALWEEGVDVATMDPGQLTQLLEAAWSDPYLNNLYQGGTVSDVTIDPSTGATITNLMPYLKKELFDPTGTHNMALVQQGILLLTQSGMPLNQSQSTFGNNLGMPGQFGVAGGDPTVLSAIQRAAAATGVPYNVALAVAMAESGLNPNAVGDQGCSHGLFQLNACTGEGVGMTQAEMNDPYQNAVKALQQFKAVAQSNPGVTSNPGEWAALAQRPADPGTYATRVNGLLNSSFGANPSGLVPKPFNGNFPVTLDYGTHFGSETEEGVDFGMPQGTAIYSPFAGTVTVEDDGKSNWGKRVFVHLANGYTFAIGHMHSFSVANGQQINPGTILGESGGDPSDPSSGQSTGAHIEVQWISAGGNYLNPHTILDPIMAGNATFQGLNLAGAEGSGVSAADAQARAQGRDPTLESEHPTAVSEWEKYFGRPPTAAELTSLVARAGDTQVGLENYLRLQPSHVPGLSLGVYNDTKQNLDSVSQSLFGHAGTDQMVKELSDAGMSDAKSIQFWLTQQDIQGKMGANWQNTYNAIYHAAQPIVQGLTNDTGFDPRWAQSIYSQAYQQGQPPVGSPAAPAPAGVRNQPGVNPGQ